MDAMPKPRKRSTPRILIIAGPNGAGKTTFAEQFLPREAECPDFINADLIARGLSPFRPEAVAFDAAEIMLSTIRRKVGRRESFAFETTLAGRTYATRISEWRKLGYQVKLIFLSLPSADVAVARVASRVALGGHSVPKDVIRRRFDAGLKNFHNIYTKLVNSWVLYDNSGDAPILIAAQDNP